MATVAEFRQLFREFTDQTYEAGGDYISEFTEKMLADKVWDRFGEVIQDETLHRAPQQESGR